MDFIVTVNERNKLRETPKSAECEWIKSESIRKRFKDTNTVYARVSHDCYNREINRLNLSITIGYKLIENMGAMDINRMDVFFNRDKVKILMVRFNENGEYALRCPRGAVGKSFKFTIPHHIVLKNMCHAKSMEVLWQQNDETSIIVDLSELEGGNE